MKQIEQFLGIETGAFDAQFVDSVVQIGDGAEIEPDGRAARRRLRLPRRPNVFDRLACLGQFLGQPRPIRVRRDGAQFLLARHAGDIASHQCPQRFKFQCFSACILHGCEMLFR